MSSHNPLGEKTQYPDVYAPELLFPIERQLARANLPEGSEALGFRGHDLWSAYELSWLDSSGKPHVALAEIKVSCSSPCLVESKSLKLYLNSLNQSRFDSQAAVRRCIEKDLSRAAGDPVEVVFYSLDEPERLDIVKPLGECLDSLPLSVEVYHPDPSLLQSGPSTVDHGLLYTHLLKTNCPITGQPDWATLLIEYSGLEIDKVQLLAYIISFRQHQDYHEHCVERIFCDIKQVCKPQRLSVYARYTRRGGLDINPFRSDYEVGQSAFEKNPLRLSRQ